MRAEGCGIAETADQWPQAAPNPRSSIPVRGEANGKKMYGIFIQRMMTRANARTVLHLVLVCTISERR
jgi:hypothetical protein